MLTKGHIVFFNSSLLIQGLSSSRAIAFQAHEKLKYVALLDMLRQGISVPICLVAVYMRQGVAFIILVRSAAAVITLAVTWRVSMSVEPFQFFSRLRAERTLLREGLRFTVLEFLITLNAGIDLVMLSLLTSQGVLGVNAFAQSLADQGLLVRAAVSQSLFPASTKALVANRISARTIISHTALCGGLMLLPALLPPLVSSHVVAFIVGPDYSNSMPIINVLVFDLVFSYARLPAGVFLQAAGHESLIIGVGAGCAILNIGGNLWLFHLVGPICIAYSTLIVFGASAVSQIGMALAILSRRRNSATLA